MPTVKKEAAIEELRQRIASAKSLFFTNYTGLTVGEITRLRNELRKAGTSYAVVKNTLFARAAGDELAAAVEQFLAGPTGVVFADTDPVAPAKAIKTFSDGGKALEVKAAYVDGKILAPSEVATLAALPPKSELQAKLLGMFASPLRGFASLLAANPGGFVRVLNARAQQAAEPSV